ncbi:uncharacterized protein SPSK_07250 [Sporothrix schenckii 1099-18]|uniref:FAD-binding PCMH-type domain-containing protein n=2 Tax=Sporothrix schenckii TaxID=29908 RepID=U7PJM1_SPOS1|nr:uncharacterized protein SPSK_07250 [Sporothrix schenckii 1099-18]ERS94899.1 hypothetical protein HMPREF1624_08797 [Sporothrix schenckii ATCC 58251]KJR88949.1 hypothetical protein SPSK_07250 [Sporothrix schenckii 1099-18]
MSSATTKVATLEEAYSGPPPRLQDEATAKRDRIAASRTLPARFTRRRGLQPPPGMSIDTFLAAIAELRAELKGGDDLIQVNDDGVDLVDGWYLDKPASTHDAFHVADPEALASSAVIFPRSTADVQAIVRWANRHTSTSKDGKARGIPLYPISMGRNLGYGGAAPRIPGGVVLDLGRNMHQILDLDGGNASCIVEPGVSYFALYEAVQQLNEANKGTQTPLWIDCPDLGGGSVLGNAVDRGVGYTPYGDHFGNHCGMEVVLPDGSLLRTGMGALPGASDADGQETDNTAWQSFQHSFGPAVHGLFSQSSLGIVVKMGFHLMPAPPAHQSYCLTFPREDDFAAIVEVIRPLAQQGVLGNIPQLRHVVQELNVTGQPRATFRQGTTEADGPLTADEVHAAAAKLPLGDCAWVFYGTQYGASADALQDQIASLHRRFLAAIPGTRLVLPDEVPGDHYLHARALVCAGVPVLRELDWLHWVPNGAHLFFSPIAPTRAADARALHALISELHAAHGFDLFPTLCVAGREMHYISNIVYDRADADAKRRAVRLMRAMIAACAARGFGEYRTHLLFADQVARTYSWGGQALLRLHETIKDALDPQGVLAPGRNGIWPAAYRGEGWELGVDDVDLDVIQPKNKQA